MNCVRGRFTRQTFQYSHNCTLGSVSVYNGDRILPGNRIAQLCGLQRLMNYVTSDANKMLVHFVTGATATQYQGFSATYSRLISNYHLNTCFLLKYPLSGKRCFLRNTSGDAKMHQRMVAEVVPP